jgi:protein Mpv17
MVVISSWMIWPAAHAVNFEVIPAKQRLLYINVVQVLFNTILSFILNAPVGIY